MFAPEDRPGLERNVRGWAAPVTQSSWWCRGSHRPCLSWCLCQQCWSPGSALEEPPSSPGSAHAAQEGFSQLLDF